MKGRGRVRKRLGERIMNIEGGGVGGLEGWGAVGVKTQREKREREAPLYSKANLLLTHKIHQKARRFFSLCGCEPRIGDQ